MKFTMESNLIHRQQISTSMQYRQLTPNMLLLMGSGSPCLPSLDMLSSSKDVHTAASSGGSQQWQRGVHATARGNGCHEVANVRPRLLPLVIEYVHLHTDCRKV